MARAWHRTGLAALLIAFPCFLAASTGDSARDSAMHDERSAPDIDSLLPYQSAVASFRRKLPADAQVALVVTLRSPAESYATMVARTLEAHERNFAVTVTRLGSRGEEYWRIHALSEPFPVGDLSEAAYHELTGWAFSVAAWFQSDLQNVAFRL